MTFHEIENSGGRSGHPGAAVRGPGRAAHCHGAGVDYPSGCWGHGAPAVRQRHEKSGAGRVQHPLGWPDRGLVLQLTGAGHGPLFAGSCVLLWLRDFARRRGKIQPDHGGAVREHRHRLLVFRLPPAGGFRCPPGVSSPALHPQLCLRYLRLFCRAYPGKAQAGPQGQPEKNRRGVHRGPCGERSLRPAVRVGDGTIFWWSRHGLRPHGPAGPSLRRGGADRRLELFPYQAGIWNQGLRASLPGPWRRAGPL